MIIFATIIVFLLCSLFGFVIGLTVGTYDNKILKLEQEILRLRQEFEEYKIIQWQNSINEHNRNLILQAQQQSNSILSNV